MEFGSSHIYYVPPMSTDQLSYSSRRDNLENTTDSSHAIYDNVPLLDQPQSSSQVVRSKEKNETKKKKKRKPKSKEKEFVGINNPSYESVPPVIPSAPTMYTLLRSERTSGSRGNHHEYSVPAADETSSEVFEADTNIISVKLGVVADSGNSLQLSSTPNLCPNCNAVVMDPKILDQLPWTCPFCDQKSRFVPFRDPHVDSCHNDVTFVVEASDRNIYMNISGESLVVFCIDTSGSMCVTREVHGAQGAGSGAYVSRLQSVKDAVIRQIRSFEAERPSTHVAVVVFNNKVEIFGDGSAEQHICLQDCQTEDEDYLSSVVRNIPPLHQVCSSADRLCELVESLTENGATALGPALFVSCQLAQRYTSSQVILCTDGRANIGVGSLESEDDYNNCHYFYDQVSNKALQYGAVVSVMSIGGADCRLVELGKVAHKTSGKVRKLDVEDVEMEMQKLIDDRPIATDVTVQVVTSKLLSFSHADMLESRENLAISNMTAKYIGNITAESEVAFRYGIDNIQDQTIPSQVPFQLKIFYRSPDGSKQLRVITENRPVTDNLKVAESDMNPTVIGTYAAQSAGKLALQGEVARAQQINQAHRALLERGAASRTSKSSSASSKSRKRSEDLKIYGQVRAVMEDVDVQLNKASKVARSQPQLQEDERNQDISSYAASSEYLTPVIPMRKKFQDRPLPEIPTQAKPNAPAEDILSKLSPKKDPKLSRKKKKSKNTRAERYDDQTAQQIYEFSSLHSSKFAMNES